MDDEDHLMTGGSTMWQNLPESCWPFLLFIVVIVLSAWAYHRHNRNAARKGQNPHHIRIRFGRSSFHKTPEQPYTGDRKINRHWKS